MNRIKLFSIAAVGMLLLATTAYAAEFKFAHEKNDTTVSVPSSETHKNLYAVGANVDINGTTLGDLFAAGGIVTTNGTVEKDLNVAGGNLNINGTVGDDARIAGGNISISSPIAGDLLVGGGNVTISEKATVGGDLVAGGGNVTLDSSVKGKAQFMGGQITINGKINGDLNIRAQKGLTFGPNSEVTGKITYEGPTEAVIQDGAKVSAIQFTKTVQHNRAARTLGAIFAIATLIKLIGLLIAGLVLYWIFPRKISAVVDQSHQNTWKSLGLGFVFMVVTPIVGILLCITIIGFYLGLIVFLAYLLTLILASIFMLYYVGNLVFKWMKKYNMSVRMDLVLGTVVVLIVTFIPFIGRLAIGIVYLIALGSFITHFKREHMFQ